MIAFHRLSTRRGGEETRSQDSESTRTIYFLVPFLVSWAGLLIALPLVTAFRSALEKVGDQRWGLVATVLFVPLVLLLLYLHQIAQGYVKWISERDWWNVEER